MTESVRQQSRFTFGTKAETLERLKPLVGLGHWPEQLYFSVGAWRSSRAEIVRRILERLRAGRIVVRSSARDEDVVNASKAGAYLSVLDVDPTPEALEGAVESVIGSYDDGHPEHQVLVQEHVTDIVVAGVVLTRDLDTGSPYYVINYDDSGRSDTVTGGTAENKATFVLRKKVDSLRSTRFRTLMSIIRRIEKETGQNRLDIEFCIDGRDKVYILQVRMISAARTWDGLPDTAVESAIAHIHAELQSRMRPAEGIHGATTVLGHMPDWNPAEMIGTTPKPLALSLYQHLITDRAWLEARQRMGYRALQTRPLLVELAGCPFIDVRASLNSFLPASLETEVAERVVNAQIELLATYPDRHDKIEFEIATTCYDFSFEGRARALYGSSLSEEDIRAYGAGLQQLTRSLLVDGIGRIDRTMSGPRRLKDRLRRLVSFPPRERVRRLLSLCIRDGTLPFAQLARDGFIAVSLLRSLVVREVLSTEDRDQYMRGVHTVATQLTLDIHRLSSGSVSLSEFLEQYGHLRPGTYDVLSWRYDERPDLYLGASPPPPPPAEPFQLSFAQHHGLQRLLAEAALGTTPVELLGYISAAIVAREEAKFEFTRCISEALTVMVEEGKRVGLSREDVAFLRIEDFLDTTDSEGLSEQVQQNREAYRTTRAIRLPHLILEPSDVDVVRLPLGQPSYITSGRVTAQTCFLTTEVHPDLTGRIVLIDCADPGYDWIFSHGIGALITKFGGANSHMAIRCAEFGLPAAIGCGDRLFDSLRRAGRLHLDCSTRSITVLG